MSQTLAGFLTLAATEFEATEINALENIKQSGTYLVLSSITPDTKLEDNAEIAVVVAGNSLVNDINDNAIGKVAEVRKKILSLQKSGEEIEFEGVKPVEFEGTTLFLYVVLISAKVTV